MDGRQLLKQAGLDLSRYPIRPPVEPIDTASEAECSAFCAYTGGRSVLLAGTGDGEDEYAVVGRDVFSQSGRIVRYQADGTEPQFVDPLSGSLLRRTRDLHAASGMPFPEDAIVRERDGVTQGPLPLIAPDTGSILAIAVRHGRFYYVTSSLDVLCRMAPSGRKAGGWQRASVEGEFATSEYTHSELRVSETLVYLNLADRLCAWHSGQGGPPLLNLSWQPTAMLPLVRISADRVLCIQQVGRNHVAEVHDLSLVAQGLMDHSHRLAAQDLGEVPTLRPHRLWAEAVREQFVVRAADGSIWVMPFDGKPTRQFENLNQWRLTDPTIWRSTAGAGELGAWCHAASSDSGQSWLLEVPLRADETERARPLRQQPWPSYQLPPCFTTAHLITVTAGNNGVLTVHRADPEHPQELQPSAQQTLPGSANASLMTLQRIWCRGHLLIHLEHEVGGFRIQWLADEELQRIESSEDGLGMVRSDRDARVLWDAAAVYLCNLDNGTVTPWRPS